MDMRDYELMYIVRPTVTDEQLPQVIDRVGSMAQSLGGQALDTNIWGKRRLAYPIDKHEDGYYVVSKLSLDPGRTGELEDQLRIYDEVIRHMLVRWVEQPQPAPRASTPAQPAPAAQ